ncbi:MAG: anaerobic ribonucleoside-triphosphate reductase [Candidatus Odinarchaeia archaeon]
MSKKNIELSNFTSQELLSAISNPMRTEMLKILSRSEPLTFTELLKLMELDSTQTGKFSYHLKALKESNILYEQADSKYSLTDIGKKIVDFLWELDDMSKQAKSNFLVRRSKGEFEGFDRERIKDSLIREADMPKNLADKIAKEAEERLIKLNIKYLTSSLIREFVNAILLENSLTRLGLPIYDVTQLITESQKKEYGNPEELVYEAGKSVFNQYTLQKILPLEISDAHISGVINIPHISEWILKSLTINHDINLLLQNNHNFTNNHIKNLVTIFKEYATHILEDQVLNNFNTNLSPLTHSIQTQKLRELFRLFFKNLDQANNKVKLTIILDSDIPLINAFSTIKINKEPYNLNDYQQEIKRTFKLILIEYLDTISPLNSRIKLVLRVTPKVIAEVVDIFNERKNNPHLLNNILFTNKNSYTDATSINKFGFMCHAKWKRSWRYGINRTGILDYVNINLIHIANKATDTKTFQDMLEHNLNLAYNTLSIKYSQLNDRLNKNNLLPSLSRRITSESYYKLENTINEIALFGYNQAIEILSNKKLIGDEVNTRLDILKHIYLKVKSFQDLSGLRWGLTLTPLPSPPNRLLIKEKIELNSLNDDPNKIILPYILPSSYFNGNSAKIIKKINNYLNGGYLTTIKCTQPNSKQELKQLLLKAIESNISFFKFTY